MAYCLFALGCVVTYVPVPPLHIQSAQRDHLSVLNQTDWLNRGTALSIWQAIVGRFVAGIGGSGMVALLSVMITGKEINISNE